MVTGGAGWLGSHLVQALNKVEAKIVVYDNLKEATAKDLIQGRAEMVNGDILDFALLTDTVRRYRVNKIVHAAAIVGTPASFAQPALTIRVNIEGTINVLEVMKNERVMLGVNISTEETYGEFQYEPAGEDHPLKPASLYGITKVAVEQIADYYYRLYKVNMISARASWLYGPRLHRLRPPQNFIENALQGKKTIVACGGDQRIDYTYITDFTDGLISILNKVNLPYRVYNISSGRAYNLYEMARIMEEVVPGSEFEIGPGLIHFSEDFPAPQKGALNIERARRDLGFSPKFDLREGLRQNIKEVQS
jgi:nucleoside-diphosphate-sugar epimerase